MLKSIKLLSVILFAILMTACAIQPFNHIDREARSHFDAVDTYLVVPQDEIYADIHRSQATAMMGGGLLWALVDASVDNSRTKKAEDIIAPIKDQLIDYDFAEILAEKIDAKLKGVDWLNAKELVLERAATDDQLSTKYKSCDSAAILFMNADYKLSADFNAIITRVNLRMFTNRAELQKYREKVDNNDNPVDQADNIYRNVISATIPLDVAGKKEEIVKALASEECKAVKAALEESADKVAGQIYDDILLDETADVADKKE